MPKKEIVLGVLLSVAVAMWATSSAVFAKSDHANNGKGPSTTTTTHGKSAESHGHQSSSTTTTEPTETQSNPGNSGTHGSTSSHGASATKGSTSNGSSPPGNNGTVKMDNYTDGNGNDVAHNNEPHVSCSWGVDAYGYEASAPTGTESFLQHPPTSGGTAQQATLTNSNPRGTGATYNGSTTNSLALVGSPHPIQGYHVKLTYTATDGNTQGNTVKHKVFWVQPCEGNVTTPTTTSVSNVAGSLVLGLQGAVSASTFHAASMAVSAHHAAAVRGTPAFTG